MLETIIKTIIFVALLVGAIIYYKRTKTEKFLCEPDWLKRKWSHFASACQKRSTEKDRDGLCQKAQKLIKQFVAVYYTTKKTLLQ